MPLMCGLRFIANKVYVMFCYVMLCYVMLCYVMLCYVRMSIKSCRIHRTILFEGETPSLWEGAKRIGMKRP